tara:strand:+ start:2033 stop:2914 length:882 start_codon:yes stop_codon:yes gene_type:complete
MARKDDFNEETITPDEVRKSTSTLEDIDFAVYQYFDDVLDLKTTTNKGFRKTPVVWAGSERAHNIKNDELHRDLTGQIILPIISIERDSVKKTDKARIVPHAAVTARNDLKGGWLKVNRVIKQDKTSNFANADAHRRKKQLNYPLYRGQKNPKIVYETHTIAIPIYVEVGYKIVLRTEYQEQMNDLLTPIVRSPGTHKMVMIGYNSNKYEAVFDEDYAMSNNISSYETNERKYETSISMNVYGYLIGDDKNEEMPRIAKRENAVQIRFARERIILQDEDGNLHDPDVKDEYRF